ncbi:MAG: hypothetical protein H6729_07955 [Deltaproteobacteria bacterium]|nr:hypothetical protein [Deltaproteobacteria bacterium]
MFGDRGDREAREALVLVQNVSNACGHTDTLAGCSFSIGADWSVYESMLSNPKEMMDMRRVHVGPKPSANCAMTKNVRDGCGRMWAQTNARGWLARGLVAVLSVVPGVPAVSIVAMAAAACGDSAEGRDEVRAFVGALPTAADVLVEVPAVETDVQNLTRGEVGRSGRALVGEPATFYAHSYYQAREINDLASSIIDMLEEISSYPPTTFSADVAVWGPFSEPLEPNEFTLTVAKLAASDLSDLHAGFGWKIAGRHKSETGDFVTLARGSFAPDSDDEDRRTGRGWMHIDFGRIHALEQSDEGEGEIRYAFNRTDDAVQVKAIFQGPDDEGEPATVAYSFGANIQGEGFILFGLNADIHDGEVGKEAKEKLLIRTRWRTQGDGRSDVVARGGDLGRDVAHVSQCWDDTFVSRYESVAINGTLVAEDGDSSSCALDVPDLPSAAEVPDADDVADPAEASAL